MVQGRRRGAVVPKSPRILHTRARSMKNLSSAEKAKWSGDASVTNSSNIPRPIPAHMLFRLGPPQLLFPRPSHHLQVSRDSPTCRLIKPSVAEVGALNKCPRSSNSRLFRLVYPSQPRSSHPPGITPPPSSSFINTLVLPSSLFPFPHRLHQTSLVQLGFCP